MAQDLPDLLHRLGMDNAALASKMRELIKLMDTIGVTDEIVPIDLGVPETADEQAGWQRTLDVNFTQLGSQTISNGANAIEGKSWTAENIAAGATSVAISSSGLVFTNNSTSTARYYQAASTAPLLKIKLSELCPGFVLGQSEFRCWLQGNSNGNANHEVLCWGLARDPWVGGVSAQTTWNWQLGAYDSASPRRGVMATAGTTQRADVDLTSPTASGNGCITGIHMRDVGHVNWYFGSTAAADTAASDDAATFSSLSLGAVLRSAPAQSTAGGGVVASGTAIGYTSFQGIGLADPNIAHQMRAAADLVLQISSASNNTAGHLVSTIKRLVVEWKP